MTLRCPSLAADPRSTAAAPIEAIAGHSARSFTARRGGCLECLAGRLWATRSGDPRDHELVAGDRLTVAPGVRVAVQAVGDARLRFIAA